ncbi:uncharacterized protein LOC135398848 [Ornithodoros turicata]|uniref:uncharacterized protein LOC135398848 n=1 Tax=Ornithodoros turicata TaxID=34597 RepID=UPI00313A0F2D
MNVTALPREDSRLVYGPDSHGGWRFHSFQVPVTNVTAPHRDWSLHSMQLPRSWANVTASLPAPAVLPEPYSRGGLATAQYSTSLANVTVPRAGPSECDASSLLHVLHSRS